MPHAAPTTLAEPRAAYIHVPFCVHRCGYCNFTVAAGRDDLIAGYLAALEMELAALGRPREVETLFFGGGTPTHLPPADLCRLLRIVRRWFPLAEPNEMSVEANPIDIDAARLDVLEAAGVNRLSLGAQSFRLDKLRLLERDHQAEMIARAMELARPRVASLSLDLIFAAPGETLEEWLADVEQAVALKPSHVSTYGLTFERGTTFWGRQLRGELPAADDELQRAMFGQAIDRLAKAGYEHYEVSNHALPGYRCRHNETYWAAAEYFAAGPGAARYVAGRREVNHRSTTTYIKRVLAGQSPVAESETLLPPDRAREALVLGLRRMAGIDREAFARQTGFEVESLVGEKLPRHIGAGLLADDGRRIRLTREGLFVSDGIWGDFLRV
ncbi:MAG: radical SAM family heme chaperone HemW [Pirellulales bacterium]